MAPILEVLVVLVIRDAHLLDRVQKQSEARGHKTLARTARDLLAERLYEIEQSQSEPRRSRPKQKVAS